MADILNAAAGLFAECGYQGTSTQVLADAVGLVKATLYYHIGSKEELLVRIATTVLEERNSRWQDALDTDERTAAEQLGMIIAAHCDMLPEYRDWFLVISDELKHLPPDRLNVVLALRAVGDDLVRGIIERGEAAGEFQVGDTRDAGVVVMAIINSMTRWYHPRGRLKADRIVAQVGALMLHGVSVKA